MLSYVIDKYLELKHIILCTEDYISYDPFLMWHEEKSAQLINHLRKAQFDSSFQTHTGNSN